MFPLHAADCALSVISHACMVQVTCLSLQQSTSASAGGLHTHSDSSSSDSSEESDSSREGQLDRRARAGSQEEEQMRASGSGRGDSNEVAELKHQLAAAQDQLRDSQGAVRLEREMVRVTRV